MKRAFTDQIAIARRIIFQNDGMIPGIIFKAFQRGVIRNPLRARKTMLHMNRKRCSVETGTIAILNKRIVNAVQEERSIITNPLIDLASDRHTGIEGK